MSHSRFRSRGAKQAITILPWLEDEGVHSRTSMTPVPRTRSPTGKEAGRISDPVALADRLLLVPQDNQQATRRVMPGPGPPHQRVRAGNGPSYEGGGASGSGSGSAYVPPHLRNRQTQRQRQRKAWVLVRNTHNRDYSKVRDRRRCGDEGDTAGVCVTLINREAVDSIRKIDSSGRGRWAPKEELDVAGVHWVGSREVERGRRVNLSRAVGPFHERVVLPRIRQGGEYIAPAYAKNGSITDTQLCVSGGVNMGEEPIDAAVREIREELGLATLEISPGGVSVVDRKGVEHFMFFARV